MVQQGVLSQAQPLGRYVLPFHKSYPDQTLPVHVNTHGNSKKNNNKKKARPPENRRTSAMGMLRQPGFVSRLPPC